MASVSLVVIVESIRTIVTKEGDELQAFHLPSIIAVGAALRKSHFNNKNPHVFLTCYCCSRQVYPLCLLIFNPQEFQPGSGSLGGPPQ